MVCGILSHGTHTKMISSLGRTSALGPKELDYDTFQVLGASDPSSGTASVHEAIRGFGTLLRDGWKPLRTILIASWDGEEVRILPLYCP